MVDEISEVLSKKSLLGWRKLEVRTKSPLSRGWTSMGLWGHFFGKQQMCWEKNSKNRLKVSVTIISSRRTLRMVGSCASPSFSRAAERPPPPSPRSTAITWRSGTATERPYRFKESQQETLHIYDWTAQKTISYNALVRAHQKKVTQYLAKNWKTFWQCCITKSQQRCDWDLPLASWIRLLIVRC